MFSTAKSQRLCQPRAFSLAFTAAIMAFRSSSFVLKHAISLIAATFFSFRNDV